uniref:Uncharacterized protein n=1 Tax=virus sp. ctBM815 TaxID=2825806 RepID=A0A8S5RJC4_9VIRU|nr:MAG TPA: hypothetical protein [virus sp. ctBM815]
MYPSSIPLLSNDLLYAFTTGLLSTPYDIVAISSSCLAHLTI